MESEINDNIMKKVNCAVPIVLSTNEHTFELDEKALASIVCRDDIKDRDVVIVSVAGAFRKGKSFLLNFFLRYLKAKYLENDNSDQWLGTDNEVLNGFSWCGGSDRNTTGILMWSDVFLTELSGGRKVAIFLLDTQGAFDSKSTVRDCATVFALSTMISSVQIYNLSQNIQEDDLQHLQLFTEYGRLAMADSGTIPFQCLQFLVRDWSYPYEAKYGAEGGKQLLTKRLEVSDKQHPELQSLREHIKACFSKIECFLLPHPGLKVATNLDFDGRLADIESEFKIYLKQLIPMLLSPGNLVLKKINGQKIKARELLHYFKSYINMYSGNELPEPKSMLMATAEANNLSAVAESKEIYTSMMEEICGGNKPYLATASLELQHLRICEKALDKFDSRLKMGGAEFSKIYRSKLEEDLQESFNQFKQHNESKNIFKSARTPAVFAVLAIIFYALSGIFGLIGMYSVANSCNLFMGLALMTLMLWAYIRYSGELREIGVLIDDYATFLWENFMKPIYQKFGEPNIATDATIIGTGQAAEFVMNNIKNTMTNTTTTSTSSTTNITTNNNKKFEQEYRNGNLH